MRFPFVVSVHDVAPATADQVADWVADLDERDLPATLLIIPGPFDGGPALPSAPGLVDFLHAAANRGHELSLHGFRHEGEPGGPPWRRAVNQVLARGAGEFWSLTERQARALLRAGLDMLADVDIGVSGFTPPFLDTLARDYGAAMQLVDYRTAADAAAARINAWVGDHTHGKITKLLAPGTLDSRTRLVLVNAVYLKAHWAQPFDASLTASAPFHGPDGDVTARFMHREESLPYAKGDGYQAVELPYKGGQLAMDLILPDAGRLPALETRLGHDGIAPLLGQMHPARVALGLPKLDLTSRFELGEPLQQLGARDIFSDHADLSGITTQEPLQLSRVVHEVKLIVDEKGTEAAAATGAVAQATAAPVDPPIPMTLDRPFVLAVRDKGTGEILFLARIEKP